MSTGAIITIIVLVLAIIVGNIYLIKKSAKFGIKPQSNLHASEVEEKQDKD
jgi:uncharacterized membrane protein (DUF485 family)